MDKEIKKAKTCNQCHLQLTRHSPPLSPLHPWEWLQRPWTRRIHVDYTCPFLGKNITTAATIDKLRSMFATYGLTEILVSDNGTSYNSSDSSKGMIFITSELHHIPPILK